MRILVTGGAGFIGSNLAQLLLAEGHEVGIIDDLSTGKAENVHASTWFREMSVLDAGLAESVTEFAPDAVVHLAAQVSVHESMRDPERDRAINVEGTRAVARAAAAAGARRVISASSAAVYGEPEVVPLPETARKAPTNPYGASKLEAESVLAEELRPRGVDFASFRFSNVYGPRQDALGEGGVVAIFANRMVAGEPPAIFGDGLQTRDFIYVGDVVTAVLAALRVDSPLAQSGTDGHAFNVSTGTELSVEHLAETMREAAGYRGAVEHLPAREGDVERSALDPTKAACVFGWRAAVPLERGVAMTVRWFSHGE